ncbi:hypothetical protein D9M68_1006350 [compost metagenome]
MVIFIRLRLSCQPYTAAAIHGCDQKYWRISTAIANTATITPPRLKRKLSPPGVPSSITARLDSSIARARNTTAMIRVLRRVCLR